jgi:hypothetical protein
MKLTSELQEYKNKIEDIRKNNKLTLTKYYQDYLKTKKEIIKTKSNNYQSKLKEIKKDYLLDVKTYNKTQAEYFNN